MEGTELKIQLFFNFVTNFWDKRSNWSSEKCKCGVLMFQVQIREIPLHEISGGVGPTPPPWYPMWVPKPLVTEGLRILLSQRIFSFQCVRCMKIKVYRPRDTSFSVGII